MRFGIRDLMFATGLVASYCAMAAAGLFGTLDGLRQTAIPGTWMLVAVCLLAKLFVGRPNGQAGPMLCRLQPKIGWWLHVTFAVITLILGLLYQHLAESDKSPLPSLLPLVVAQTYIYSYFTVASLHEGGLSIGRKLFRFNKHRFHLKSSSTGTELAVQGRWRAWLNPWQLAAIVPETKVDQVREILIAKKALAGPSDEEPAE